VGNYRNGGALAALQAGRSHRNEGLIESRLGRSTEVVMETEMKSKIESAANIIVILFAVIVGSVFLKDRLSTLPPESNVVKAGDKLANLDGWDWSAHDQTLVLVLRKGCHFCEDSAPFYQRLNSQQQQGGSNSRIVAVFPDTNDAVKEVVQSEGLGFQALSGVPLERLNVSATPTLLLVDKSGTVLNAWIGMLSPRQELEVMRATTAPTTSVLKGPGSMVQNDDHR
jgi:thioredoxin-related protein